MYCGGEPEQHWMYYLCSDLLHSPSEITLLYKSKGLRRITWTHFRVDWNQCCAICIRMVGVSYSAGNNEILKWQYMRKISRYNYYHDIPCMWYSKLNVYMITPPIVLNNQQCHLGLDSLYLSGIYWHLSRYLEICRL